MNDGRPRLLLIHGLLAASPVWDGVMREVGDAAECIAPDLPGHRRTPWPGGTYTLHRVLDLLEPLVDRVRPTHVLGHSMGGIIALGMAARRPDEFASVGVVGLPVYATRNEGVARIGARGRRWRAAFASDGLTHAGCLLAARTGLAWKWWMRRRYPLITPAVLQTVFDHRRAAHGSALNEIVFGGHVDALAARQTTPIAAFHGANDTAAPVAPVRVVAERWGWDLVVEDGGNHQVIVERPRLVAEWVRARLLAAGAGEGTLPRGEERRDPIQDRMANGELIHQRKPFVPSISMEDGDLVGGGPEA